MPVDEWQTPEQQEVQRRWDAEHARVQRLRANLLQFYTCCPHKRCRRAKSCQVENSPCVELFVPHIPMEFKIWLRAAIKARLAGQSLEEANETGRAEVERCKQLQAKLDEMQNRAKSAEPTVSQAPAMARVRRL